VVRDFEPETIPQAALELGHQRVALLAIQQPHAPDVAGEIALAHELGEHGLAQARRVPVREVTIVALVGVSYFVRAESGLSGALLVAGLLLVVSAWALPR
jgi:hypothetical protein